MEVLFNKPNLLSMQPTDKATERYNSWLQGRLKAGVFYSCDSWYRVNGVGKVTSIFPGSGTLFWRLLRKVAWADYQLTWKDETAI